MDLERFRSYCLALEGVSEKMPFGRFAARYDSVLAFYVSGHMFCFVDIDDFTFVDLKSSPDEIAELQARYVSWDRPLNRSLRYWIRIRFGGDVADETVCALVARAYDLVKAQYARPPRLRKRRNGA